MPAAEESLMEPVEENTENPPSPRHQYEPPQRQRILEVMRLGTEKETNQKTRQKTQPIQIQGSQIIITVQRGVIGNGEYNTKQIYVK